MSFLLFVVWADSWRKIFDSFDFLSKILEGKAICYEDSIEIFDPPYTIKILKKDKIVTFYLDSVCIATLNKNGLDAIEEDGVEELVDEWCMALTSLGFKRYSLKKKN
jgi:hypothetical protein